MAGETDRQLFHMAVGAAALAVLLLLGRGIALAGAFFTLIIGTLLINIRLLGHRIPVVSWFEERFERKNPPLPGWGSACYAAGVLLAISFLTDASQIAAVIFILGIGDALSTLVGLRGRIPLPYNAGKTLEGTAAMFFVSLGAFWFVGPVAVPLALAAAFAESLPRVDDNLSVPIACTAVLLVLA